MSKFTVGLTGPEWAPSDGTKWYAQLLLTSHDEIPLGVKTFAFGPTPEEAMTELAKSIRLAGVTL